MPPTPITFAHTQAPLRLIELPPSVCNKDTESLPPLSLKATPTGPIFLTTPSHTYAIRQVQTSNTVFLLSHTGDALEISGQVSSYLESDDAPLPSSAVQVLTTSLPVYSGADDVDPDGEASVTREALYANIPFSQTEIDEAWTWLVAFECHGQCFRPTDEVLGRLWTAVISAAAAEGTDLTLPVAVDQLYASLGEDFPKELLTSVLRRLAVEADSTGNVTLDKEVAVPWVGKVLLARTGQDVSAFLDTWRDALPEAWRVHVSGNAMAKLHSHAQDGAESARVGEMVKKVAGEASQGENTKANVSGAQEAVQKRSGPQRNWHEKFKRTKR